MTGRESIYPRNDVLRRALEKKGNVTVLGSSRRGPILRRSLQIGIQAMARLLVKKYDLVYVGFYGHLLMLPVGILSRQPVLFDAFISTYDTLCFDRQQFSPLSLVGRLAYHLDLLACRLADRILLDTRQQVGYFVSTYHLAPDRLFDIPVGCSETLFYPRQFHVKSNPIKVLYYCTFLPLHGIKTVLQAAYQLQGEQVQFRLIGEGLEYPAARKMAEAMDLKNVTFIPTVSLEQLPDEIAAADICLGGHFGESAKAGRVIPGKIYQILAMARPLIAADSPANKDLLTHGETALLVPPGDADSLVGAVRALRNDSSLGDYLAEAGRSLFERCGSEKYIGGKVSQIVDDMCKNR